MKLTDKFVEIVPHADFCLFKKYQKHCTCEKGSELTLSLIQAVREYNKEVVGEPNLPVNDDTWTKVEEYGSHMSAVGYLKARREIRRKQEELL